MKQREARLIRAVPVLILAVLLLMTLVPAATAQCGGFRAACVPVGEREKAFSPCPALTHCF